MGHLNHTSPALQHYLIGRRKRKKQSKCPLGFWRLVHTQSLRTGSVRHSPCEKAPSVIQPPPDRPNLIRADTGPGDHHTSSSQLIEHLPSREAHCEVRLRKQKETCHWTHQHLLRLPPVTEGQSIKVLACFIQRECSRMNLPILSRMSTSPRH